MNYDDDEELKTIFKWRVPEKRATLIKEISILILFLTAFGLGFLALGYIQYNFVCLDKKKDITFMECIRGDYWKGKK